MQSTEAGFELAGRTRVVFGAGSVDRLGELARELGARRALLVTQPGVAQVGHSGRAERALAGAGIEVAVFDAVRENPTTLDVDRCLEAARTARPDLLVAVGGGSAIDAAKGANFLLTGGGRMRDYRGRGELAEPFLPLVAVPTTSGTGSEVQSYALISDEETHAKMACGDPQALPVLAVLDPSLCLSMPPFVTACTGMDALVHAVETAVTKNRNAASAGLSREAFRLCQAHLPRVLADPTDLASRGEMQKAACLAGLAIEHSMLGAAHSLANPLTQAFDIHHGQAVGMMLPHVVRYNARDSATAELYTGLARSAGLCNGSADAVEAVDLLVARLLELLRLCGLPESLSDCGVPESSVAALAAEAARQWTARFNPRAVGEEDFRELYRSASPSG